MKIKTRIKRKVAKATGIPTTKSGRKRKVIRLATGGVGASIKLGSGRRSRSRKADPKSSGAAFVSLVVGFLVGYVFGVWPGIAAFFISLFLISISIAKNVYKDPEKKS